MNYLLYNRRSGQLATPIIFRNYEIAAAEAEGWRDTIVLELLIKEIKHELPKSNISQTFYPGP